MAEWHALVQPHAGSGRVALRQGAGAQAPALAPFSPQPVHRTRCLHRRKWTRTSQLRSRACCSRCPRMILSRSSAPTTRCARPTQPLPLNPPQNLTRYRASAAQLIGQITEAQTVLASANLLPSTTPARLNLLTGGDCVLAALLRRTKECDQPGIERVWPARDRGCGHSPGDRAHVLLWALPGATLFCTPR